MCTSEWSMMGVTNGSSAHVSKSFTQIRFEMWKKHWKKSKNISLTRFKQIYSTTDHQRFGATVEHLNHKNIKFNGPSADLSWCKLPHQAFILHGFNYSWKIISGPLALISPIQLNPIFISFNMFFCVQLVSINQRK